MRNSKSLMPACSAGTFAAVRLITLSFAATLGLLALTACVTKQVTPSTVPVVAYQLLPPSSIQAGGQTQVVATVTNDPKMMGIDWFPSCVNANCGSFNPAHTASGQATTYTAPISVPQGGVNLAARSTASPAQTAVVNVTIFTDVTIKLTGFPASPLGAGNTTTLIALVSGDPNNPPLGVGWQLSCTAPVCGTLSAQNTASGIPVTYTAPSTVTSSFNVTFQATPLADTSQNVSATITVNPSTATSIVITGLPGSMQTGGTANVIATVSNDPKGGGVTWTATCTNTAAPGQCGTFTNPPMTASGAPITYTAPSTVPTGGLPVTITATSVDSPAVANASTTVTSPVLSVTISTPPPANMTVGSSAPVVATIQNDTSNKGVTWSATCTPAGGSSCGTFNPMITTTGMVTMYQAPSIIPINAGGVVTIVATTNATPVATAMATVTITPSTTISIGWTTPPPSTMTLGQQVNVSATVTNDPVNPPNGVNWTATCTAGSGGNCGMFSSNTTANGVATQYTAPTILPLTAVTIEAQAQANTTATVSQAVTVMAPTITVTFVGTIPTSIPAGTNASFTADVANDSTNKGVNWSVSCTGGTGTNPCGSFSVPNTPSGTAVTYTAPSTVPTGNSGDVVITATSAAESSATAVTPGIPITANVSTGLLKGQYVLSASGTSPNGFYGVVGSIIADGQGNITGGEEDTAPCGPTNVTGITGTYVVGADGRGTMTLNTGGGSCFGPSGVQTFSFAIVNGAGATAPRALVSQFNNGGGTNGSGTLNLQNPTAAISGTYGFVFAGFDINNQNANGVSTTDIGGTITVSGSQLAFVQDTNDQGLGTVTTKVSSTWTFTALDTFGRSAATDSTTGSSYAFYVVNAGQIQFLENDGSNFVEIGPAYSQGSVGATPYVFTFSGADGIQNTPVGAGGFFASGLTSGVLDFNDAGLKTGANGAAFTATVTAPSSGRGTLTLTGAPTGVSQFAYYPTANNGLLLLELDTGFATTGDLLPQSSATFANGNYATNFTNSSPGVGYQEEDAVGQVVVSASSIFTGTMDIFNTSGFLNLSSALTGTFSPAMPAGAGRYSGNFMITETPSNQTIMEFFYVADADTVLLMESDSTAQTTGIMQVQTLTPAP